VALQTLAPPLFYLCLLAFSLSNSVKWGLGPVHSVCAGVGRSNRPKYDVI